MDTIKTERRNDHLTPFSYGDHAVRTVMIDDAPWFIAKDVCEVLGIQEARSSLRDFPENEKGVHITHTPGGPQEMLTVNEPGLYRLIFQSRKPEAEKFKTWVFGEVLPSIRRTGGYEAGEAEAVAGRVYSRLAGADNMPIRRINKLMYLFSMEPPLPNADIARLMEINQSTLSYIRNLFTPGEIRAFVRELRITAFGSSEFYIEEVSRKKTGHRKPIAGERAGFPLELPEKEAAE